METRETKLNLSLFGAAENVHTTTGVLNVGTGEETKYSENGGLSEQMKTYYSDFLIDNAEPALVYDMFAQKVMIPKNAGKTIQFRKYDSLPTLNEEIKEGVTPQGQKIDMSTVNATLAQYGGYVELSDLLLMTAIDNNLVMATKLLGAQAGRTLNAITREVVCGGTNVQYGEGNVSARYLVGRDQADPNDNCYLTVNAIRHAVRFLKNQNAEKINGSYIAIIHPDCAYDLMNDPNWKYPNQYATPENIFEGEIGKIEGVRFIESSEAKIFYPTRLAKKDLFVTGEVNDSSSVQFTLSTDVANNGLANKWILIDGERYFVGSNTSQLMTIYTDETKSKEAKITVPKGTPIYPADAGKEGCKIYATVVFGDNAFGTTSVAGGGLEHIVKQLGSSGANDPLNQRATVGWKANKVSMRLCEAFMVRIETASSAND